MPRNSLSSLVGKNEDEILQLAGAPTYFVKTAESVSYVYESFGEDTYVWLAIILPMWAETGNNLSCVKLDFNSDRVLREYEIQTADGAKIEDYYMFTVDPVDSYDCKFLFDLDINDIYTLDRCVYESIGHDLGIHKIYRQLPVRMHSPDISTRFHNLCNAANQGHSLAQSDIGRYFSIGYDKIQQDYRLAYVWYSLANRSCDNSLHLQQVKQQMSDSKIAEAEKMLQEWDATQCESQIGQYYH